MRINTVDKMSLVCKQRTSVVVSDWESGNSFSFSPPQTYRLYNASQEVRLHR